MFYQLTPLPYPIDALEPVLHAEALHYHHDRIQAGYVDKLNQMAPPVGTADQTEALKILIRTSAVGSGLFNTAAQLLNHETYWSSLRPGGSVMPLTLQSLIEHDFGSVDALHKKLVDASVEQFGSGWVWLVAGEEPVAGASYKDWRLHVCKTANADTPVRTAFIPLLCIDVWEHAYYLDYRNERRRYAEALLPLLDWQKAYDRLVER